MTEQPPPQPSPDPHPMGGPPPPPPVGVPRPGELVDRFLARLIDGVLLGIVFGVLYSIGAAIFLQGIFYSRGEWFVFWLFTAILSTAVNLGYFAFMESTNGATLGKQLLKLKVVGPDGVSNPTMEQALRRNAWLGLGLINVLPFVGSVLAGLAELAAVIMIAVGINNDTVNRQAWHDHFAGGTKVLKIG